MTLGYKQYVGDISKLTLPSKLDQKPSHPGLNKNAETQRLAKQIKERQENDEIAQGKVEIVVDSVQTHIQLILRLVKAAYQSLDEYKKDAEWLRSEIFDLRQKLVEENEDVLNELSPQLLQNYKSLKNEIKANKNENDLKYKELLNLKKGNAQLQQIIDSEVQIVEDLELYVKGATDGYESGH